jgi:hypothetical protein
MGAATDIATGFAQIIAASGAAVFNPSGAYPTTTTDTCVVFKTVPPTPNRLVTITVVPLVDDLAAPQGQVMVQLRYRGNPNLPLDVDDLGDQIKPLFHGLKDTVMGSVTVVQCDRRQSVPLGQDEAKRWERADQFYLDVEYPPSLLVPDGGTY